MSHYSYELLIIYQAFRAWVYFVFGHCLNILTYFQNEQYYPVWQEKKRRIEGDQETTQPWSAEEWGPGPKPAAASSKSCFPF